MVVGEQMVQEPGRVGQEAAGQRHRLGGIVVDLLDGAVDIDLQDPGVRHGRSVSGASRTCRTPHQQRAPPECEPSLHLPADAWLAEEALSVLVKRFREVRVVAAVHAQK